jgi:hypothetical protein
MSFLSSSQARGVSFTDDDVEAPVAAFASGSEHDDPLEEQQDDDSEDDSAGAADDEWPDEWLDTVSPLERPLTRRRRTNSGASDVLERATSRTDNVSNQSNVFELATSRTTFRATGRPSGIDPQRYPSAVGFAISNSTIGRRQDRRNRRVCRRLPRIAGCPG